MLLGGGDWVSKGHDKTIVLRKSNFRYTGLLSTGRDTSPVTVTYQLEDFT